MRNNIGLLPIDVLNAVLETDEAWGAFLDRPLDGAGIPLHQLRDWLLTSDSSTSKKLNPSWFTPPQGAINLVEQRISAEDEARQRLKHLASQQSGMWSDADFRPDDSSVFIDETNPTLDLLGRPGMWPRLHEIYLNTKLQISVPLVDQNANIIQGEVGDCYFMSDLSIILSERLTPEHLVIGDLAAGVFLARFYLSGRWRWYAVDSKIPSRQANDGVKFYPVYAENKDASLAWAQGGSVVDKSPYPIPVSCWLPIYQKAYAKAHGCYELIDGGFGKLAMVDIQGGYSKSISHPTMGLMCSELSPMPTVVQMKVYLGASSCMLVIIVIALHPDCVCFCNFLFFSWFILFWARTGNDVGMPMNKAVRDGVSMRTLMQQPCFKDQENQEPPWMFVSLSDGHIEGGQFPAASKDVAMHVRWGNAEYGPHTSAHKLRFT